MRKSSIHNQLARHKGVAITGLTALAMGLIAANVESSKAEWANAWDILTGEAEPGAQEEPASYQSQESGWVQEEANLIASYALDAAIHENR